MYVAYIIGLYALLLLSDQLVSLLQATVTSTRLINTVEPIPPRFNVKPVPFPQICGCK